MAVVLPKLTHSACLTRRRENRIIGVLVPPILETRLNQNSLTAKATGI